MVAGVTPAAGAGRAMRPVSGAKVPAEGSPFAGESVLVAAGEGRWQAGVLDANWFGAFDGIAIRPAKTEHLVDIVLIERHAGRCVALGRFDDSEVVALWRSLSASLGLPLVLERPDGTLDTPYQQLGPIRLGAVRIRKLHGLLNGRRPRFLVRRKAARLPDRPTIHREREILARN